MSWQRISIEDASQLLAQRQPAVVDIRDAHSWQTAHLPGAKHLDNQSVQQFMADTNKDEAVLVYCYHGHSSQNVAAWLSEKGFKEVYSLDGGFEIWRLNQPVER
jgi:thiosulfate sulfurtransferase